MHKPRARHLLAVPAAGLAALVASAAPALAIATPIGQNGDTAPQSTVTTLLLFIGIPVVTIIVVAMVVLPSRAVGALRYRPGRAWGFSREWFGSQPEPVVSETDAMTGGSSGSW